MAPSLMGGRRGTLEVSLIEFVQGIWGTIRADLAAVQRLPRRDRILLVSAPGPRPNSEESGFP
jgi:hypothetical protein